MVGPDGESDAFVSPRSKSIDGEANVEKMTTENVVPHFADVSNAEATSLHTTDNKCSRSANAFLYFLVQTMSVPSAIFNIHSNFEQN